jgi:polysaccharide transporter, PST family
MSSTIHPPSAGTLRENIAALSILQVMNYAVPLVTVPYLVRVLGPGHFGLLSFAQAFILYFDLLTDYGFNLSATRAVASRRDEPDALARIFWRTIFVKTTLMLASAVLLCGLVISVTPLRETAGLYACAFLTVVGTVIVPVWFFQGIEQMRFLTVAQSAARFLTIPALVVLVRHPDDYVRAAAIQGACPVLAGVLLAPAIWRRIPRGLYVPRASEIAATLRDGWHLFVANASLVVNATTTTVVLGLVTSTVEVGYYSAADKVIRAVSSLLGPVTQALYPHLTNLKARSLGLTVRLMRRSFTWIGLLSLAASLATFCLANPVGMLLWGRNFVPSVLVLRCLSPMPFLLALINMIGTQTMLVFEMDALVSRILFLCTAINVVLAAALSARFGALGAAGATVGTGVLMTACLAWSLRRQGFVS